MCRTVGPSTKPSIPATKCGHRKINSELDVPKPTIHDPLIFGLGGLWPKPLRDPYPLCPSTLGVGPTTPLDNLAQSLNFQTMRSSGPHYVTTPLRQPWRAKKLILPSEHMAPLVAFFLPSWSVCRGRHYARMLLSLLAWPAALLFLRPPPTLPSWLPIVSGLLPLG